MKGRVELNVKIHQKTLQDLASSHLFVSVGKCIVTIAIGAYGVTVSYHVCVDVARKYDRESSITPATMGSDVVPNLLEDRSQRGTRCMVREVGIDN